MNDIKEAQTAYDKISEIYHNKRVRGNDFNSLIEQPTSFALLGNVIGKKLLDAGCGSGVYSKLLAKKGAEVYGLELSTKMLQLAKEHCKKHEVKFQQGSIDKLPYRKNSFDIILCSLVLHYLKNQKRVFKEFNRVLRKKGILVLSIVHPVFDAVKKINNKKNKKLINISDYFRKKRFYWHLYKSKIKIPSYPVPLGKLFDLLYKNNFIIEKFIETPIPKNKRIPRYFKKFSGLPIFIVLRCRKIK